jgi:hypothetical protein
LGNDFDWRTFDFDHDMAAVDDALAFRLNADTVIVVSGKARPARLAQVAAAAGVAPMPTTEASSTPKNRLAPRLGAIPGAESRKCAR